MLERFVESVPCLAIPNTIENFYLTISGEIVKDGRKVDVFKSNTSEKETLVDFGVGPDRIRIKLSVLLAIVFKKSRIPRHLWSLLDVHYLDGNRENHHPGNTIWKYPAEGLRYNDSEFFHIPGFSRYVINKSGEVYSLVTKKLLSSYIDSNGYSMYGVQPDVGIRTIVGKHRLLALALLPYPAYVDSLDVNHIDTIKQNNDLKNLEWLSRKGNCDHAYLNDLRSDNIRIEVRNYFTGEVAEFYSIEEAGRKLGINGGTVKLRVRSEGRLLYYPGFQFRKKGCEKDWGYFNDPDGIIRSQPGYGYPVEIIDMESNEILKFESATDAADFVGVSGYLIGESAKRFPKKILKTKYAARYVKQNFREIAKSVWVEMLKQNLSN